MLGEVRVVLDLLELAADPDALEVGERLVGLDLRLVVLLQLGELEEELPVEVVDSLHEFDAVGLLRLDVDGRDFALLEESQSQDLVHRPHLSHLQFLQVLFVGFSNSKLLEFFSKRFFEEKLKDIIVILEIFKLGEIRNLVMVSCIGDAIVTSVIFGIRDVIFTSDVFRIGDVDFVLKI